MENYIIAGICIIGMMVCVAYIGKQLYANYLETRNRRIEEINKKTQSRSAPERKCRYFRQKPPERQKLFRK